MKQRKNLLFLTNRVPFPPNKGDKIRTFHQLDHLALSYNVYCACFVDGPRDIDHAQALRRWCADVIALRWTKRKAISRSVWAWLRKTPFTTAAYRDRTMMRRLADWGKAVEFDVAVAFSSSMAPYALSVPSKRRVLDLCDVDSQKWLDYATDGRVPMSTVYSAEGRRLREYEKDCLERFDATVLITERERDILDPRHRAANLHVIPNGTTLCARRPPPPSACGSVIGFLGAMDYRPNVQGICWFVEEAWPRVLRVIPDARLRIVGRNPVRHVRRLSRVKGVEVVGEVRDARKYVSTFRMMVVPLQIARGLQNKVLEAMAMRRPVVATSCVAGGLRVKPGHNILVADEAEAFAEKVINLCQFEGLCDKIGDAGYRCVATFYSWAEVLQRYERLLFGLPVTQPPSRSRSRRVQLSVTDGKAYVFTGETPVPQRRGDSAHAPSVSGAGDGSSQAESRESINAASVPESACDEVAPTGHSRSPYATLFRGDVQSRQELRRSDGVR